MSRFLTDIRRKGAGKAALSVEPQHETSMVVPEDKLREEDLVMCLPLISVFQSICPLRTIAVSGTGNALEQVLDGEVGKGDLD